jgi:hypothetical protein
VLFAVGLVIAALAVAAVGGVLGALRGRALRLPSLSGNMGSLGCPTRRDRGPSQWGSSWKYTSRVTAAGTRVYHVTILFDNEVAIKILHRHGVSSDMLRRGQ